MKNWKTTAMGLALAFVNMWASGMTPKAAAISVGLAAFGAVSKDFDKSGL